ncbi:MAG: cyclic nucleotide-binding domain-containing protein [Syntrophobacteraceae bacterium]
MQNEKIEKDPAQAIEVAVFQIDRTILSQGQENPFFYVILSGRVMLSKNGKTIRTLGEQDIFGMEGLLLKKPSLYTAYAVEECRVARYGLETLDHFIRESPRTIQNVLVSIVRQLSDTTLNLLEPAPPVPEENERVHFYQDGELILDEMNGGTELCRLISTQGGLQVTMGGREVTRINTPGEFFGRPISYSHACVRSIGQSIVEKFGAGDLHILIRDYPESAAMIMHALIERLRAEELDGAQPQTVHIRGDKK